MVSLVNIHMCSSFEKKNDFLTSKSYGEYYAFYIVWVKEILEEKLKFIILPFLSTQSNSNSKGMTRVASSLLVAQEALNLGCSHMYYLLLAVS